MDPVSITSLVVGAVGVADVAAKLILGLRHLQQRFSGALDHVDGIAQLINSIDFAIHEICSLLHERPEIFTASFQSHVNESTGAVKKLILNIQDHVECVKNQAVKSSSRAKVQHLLNASRVAQWGENLNTQTVALVLLLEAAKLRSNGRRTSLLEQASSRIVFEQASSMSAKLAEDFRQLDPTTSSFEAVLRDTKVYRRAYEFNWLRAVKSDEEGPDSSSLNGTELELSVSSGKAIAGRAGSPDLVDRNDSNASSVLEHASLKSREPESSSSMAPQLFDTSANCDGPLLLQTTISTSSGESAESSGALKTSSTLATTVSSAPNTKSHNTEGSEDNSSFRLSKIIVVVEGVGEDHTELLLCQIPNPHNIAEEAIRRGRDRVLNSRGIDPSLYNGRRECNIKASGVGVHTFPFSPMFLTAAIEQLQDGLFNGLTVLAQYACPVSAEPISETVHTARTSATGPRLFDEKERMGQLSGGLSPDSPKSDFALPFTLDRKQCSPNSGDSSVYCGGFSRVYKVKLDSSWISHDSKGDIIDKGSYFAVKELRNRDEDAFTNEVQILRRFSKSPQPHIIELLASYKLRGRYHLIFPWADGNLVDFWKQHPTPTLFEDPMAKRRACIWMAKQCWGIAEALSSIHSVLNPHVLTDSTRMESIPQTGFGRHGDLKPENLLWFRRYDSQQDGMGTLTIADFGLGRFHNCIANSPNSHNTKKLCTPMYRAPEFDRLREPITSSSDVFSLGCVYLEFLTWFAIGWEGVCEFKEARRREASDGAFFNVSDGEALESPSTTKQIHLVRFKLLHLDTSLLDALRSFLDVIQLCFEISQNQRPSAASIAYLLHQVCQMLEDYKSKTVGS